MSRVPGGEAAAKLVIVQAETLMALARRRLNDDPPPVPDAVTPQEIPSVAELGPGDRDLAEIDQDGFTFALHPADEPFFNRRTEKFPRLRYRLHVVLYRGRVCVRKQFLGMPEGVAIGPRLWSLSGLFFFTEAAALLRLRAAGFVPVLRGINPVTRTLYMDYLRGETLQHELASHGARLLDIDLATTDQLFDPERDRWESEAFAQHGGAHRDGIEAMVRTMNRRGVAPIDVKLGNVVIGARSGALYWLDFERAALDAVPGWEAQLAEHHRLVEAHFGIQLASR
ncbi:hypothetical protein [Chondromyces crocatus]|uniref:hypothetical protein n=1 Tax=Chondromyces crocatus TaxID=52 RepID=UPI001FDFEC55|nr:hypothetical protein [Chondromyces crocatus]